MSSVIIMVTLVFVAYFWWDTMRSKEAARISAITTCKQHGLQFLDDTVSLDKLSFKRNDHGRLMFSRLYSFEFTSDASQRYKAKMRVWNGTVYDIELPVYREPDREEKGAPTNE